jgi:hypothetical protein
MSFDCFSENKENKISKIWIRRPSEKSTPLPVRIEKGGYAVWGKSSSFRRNTLHREFTIEYVSEGSIEFFLKGRNLKQKKGIFTYSLRERNTFTKQEKKELHLKGLYLFQVQNF